MSSFVGSREYGFWISDGLLEIWLLVLAREIDAMGEPAPWLREARHYWYEQATMGCMGCVTSNIDNFATSDERRNELIALSEEALRRLEEGKREQDLSIEHWYGFGLWHTTLNTFLADLPEVGQLNLLKAGKQWIRLLRSEVQTTVSSPSPLAWMHETQ